MIPKLEEHSPASVQVSEVERLVPCVPSLCRLHHIISHAPNNYESLAAEQKLLEAASATIVPVCHLG